MKHLSLNKMKLWSSSLFGIIIILIGTLTACNKSPQKQDLAMPTKEIDEKSEIGSIKNHSFFTNNEFSALKEKNPEQWKLITDLLSIYFQARYEQETILGEINLPITAINKRLAENPHLWKTSQNSTGIILFRTLSEQAILLANFPTSSSYEKYCQKALLDFFDLYLTQKMNESVYQSPKSQNLATTLKQEKVAWLHLLRAEANIGELLLQLNHPESFHHLGLQKAKFLSSLQKRRFDSDKETYFALTSPNYNPSFLGYVTWAETKSQYAKLTTHIRQQYQTQPTLCRSLANAINSEQNAWFSLIKARDAVQEALYGNAQNVYSSNSRKLKSEHIKDLQSTFDRFFQ